MKKSESNKKKKERSEKLGFEKKMCIISYSEEVIEEVIVLDYCQTSFIDRFQPSSILQIYWPK